GWPQPPRDVGSNLAVPAIEPRRNTVRVRSLHAPALRPRAKAGSAATVKLLNPQHHYLPANEKTVHWGFLSKSLRPVLTVRSGDAVTIETLTHHAKDDYERMSKGASGAESIFRWTKHGRNIERRGAGPMDASIYGRG